MRERRPGVWEVRVAAGTDPATGRTRQRSVTVHGTASDAEASRRELVAARDARRARPSPLLSLGELLELWLAAEHPWKPSTRVGYESNARRLRTDTHLARRRAADLTPNEVRRAFDRWEAAGATHSVVAARFRVLRAAVGWAYDERIIDTHPLRSMRGPGRIEPRRPLTDDQVAALLATAEATVLEAVANDIGTRATRRLRHHAEQGLLLVRLAADSGARRGELTALHFDDLDGRVLHIRRAFSADEVTSPKSGRDRSLTLGTSTARLWHTLEADWRTLDGTGDRFGRWLFSAEIDHGIPMLPSSLGHRFTRLRDTAAPLVRHCTASATTSPPSSSAGARSSRPKPAWATRMRPRPCASTPTPSLSPTPRSPIASTHTSIGPPCEPTRPRRFSP